MKGRRAMNSRRNRFRTEVEAKEREHKKTFIVFCILRALVVLCMVRQFVNDDYEGFAMCILTLLLLVLPSALQVGLRVQLSQKMEIVLLCFIYSAEVLGEINRFYVIIPFWDTILHTLNGFLAAGVGYSLVDMLNRDEKMMFKLSPAYVSIVAFCFSMTVGVLWEFFEFGMDMLFHLDMQKDTIVHVIGSVTLDPANSNRPVIISGITETAVNGHDLGINGYLDIGLIDTMEDLFVNFIGALTFSILGYSFAKSKGRKNRVVKDFMLSNEDNGTNGDLSEPDSETSKKI
jgi:hypothetical protein